MVRENLQQYTNGGSIKTKWRNIKEDFWMIMSKLLFLYNHKKLNKENVTDVINKSEDLWSLTGA